MESENQVFHTKFLSISQIQAVIKLIEKKDPDKRYVKNWRPISLLNVDTNILSKAISNKLKTCVAYVNFFTTDCLCKKQIYWRKW